jgi:hypothetical protein
MSSRLDILKQVASGELSPEKADETLRNHHKSMRFQVGKNGTVSLFGLQKRSLVFYPDQWIRLSNSFKENLFTDFISNSDESKNSRLSTLEQIASGSLTPEEANEHLKQFKKVLRFQAHKNETIILLGLQKRPIILFKDQWTKLDNFLRTDTLTSFLLENESQIANSKSQITNSKS